VQEFVTTNYDPLVELAAADIGRDLSVLPFDDAVPGRPWLLKLHGDAAHPESVVLTREEYLQFGDTAPPWPGCCTRCCSPGTCSSSAPRCRTTT
jgi:hypothetical protein